MKGREKSSPLLPSQVGRSPISFCLGRWSPTSCYRRGSSSPLLRSVDVEGVLKQDYVLVDDTRAVEFNRVADGEYHF